MSSGNKIVFLYAVATVIFLSISAMADADELSVYGGHFSVHFGDQNIKCSQHRWVGVRYNNWTAGGFQNSYCLDTVYAGYTDEVPLGGRYYLRGQVGISYGYTKFGSHEEGGNKRVFPYFGGGIVRKFDWWEAGLAVQPGVIIPMLGVTREF